MHACTIIAKNYLAQARVLADSFLDHNPGSEFAVLVIDELDGHIDHAAERFEVLSPQDIDCGPFERMAARYDILELSTAVKPWLLRRQLRAGAESITYLDPDIQVFGSLDLLHEEAVRHGLVLTPHNTRPIPDDGKRPTQIDIMIAGVYNLGYVSLGRRDEIDRLIDWWCDRLTRDCRIDPEYGYFVDQRWFDLAPGFVTDYSIIRHPEYNVAYWNAHSRDLTFQDGHYEVDGRPLAFFHFSGFDPIRPDVLSRHQTRLDLGDLPTLRQICEEYAEAVLARGHEDARKLPYTYGALANGEAMTHTLRALYARAEDEGVLSASPFTEPGCRALLNWASEQEPGAPSGINRALAHVYSRRVDLRAAFPDLSGASREPFLRWARERGPIELKLPAALLPSAADQAEPPSPGAPSPRAPAPAPAAPVPEPPPPLGVNVVGYFRSELGVGEAARQVVSALDAAALPLLPVHGATIALSRQRHSFHYLEPSAARYPINLICMNADALPDFADHAGSAFFTDRYSIGLWFWEVAAVPPGEWRESFALLDEVWAPTRHVADVIRSVSPIPVFQVRLPIEMPQPAPVPRHVLDLPDGFMFMFSFDYLSVFKRKNPMAVIEAYARAFEVEEDATLVIKCINHEHDPENHAKLLRAARARPDIQVIDSYLDPQVKDALTATCDCYVSLHRSEGFGLTMAEAMHQGKPVIATGYSGNVDFMTTENSYLIDYELVPIGDDAAPYPAAGMWAQPDVAQASAAMREVFDDQEQARDRGARGAASIRETHSAGVAGDKMKGRLDEIYHGLRVESGRLVDRSLRATVERGPVAPPRSAAGRAGPKLRQAVLRLVKPLSAHQKTVNEQVLRSLEALVRELTRVGAAQQRSEAGGLAQTRQTQREIAELRHGVDVLAAQHDVLAALHDPVVQRLDALSAEQQRIEAERRALPYMSGGGFAISTHPEVGKVQGYADSSEHVEDVYRSFEDVFRGSEEFIRERQRAFLPLLAGREPVLDFGCGRGEMLDLLGELGTDYAGVDSDPGMVARCRDKGHAGVALADGIAYLEQQAPDSLGAIFAAQVIEHLPYEVLLSFFTLSRRALKPGGVLIAETVNPHSPPALKTFWVDLTHQHPIFPEVALALSQSANFDRAYVFHPNGVGDIEVDRYSTGEYAVVATKASRVSDVEVETNGAVG